MFLSIPKNNTTKNKSNEILKNVFLKKQKKYMQITKHRHLYCLNVLFK